MESSAFESKLFQIRSKVEISRRAGHEERLSRSKLIQTPNFSPYLIQFIRFGSSKVRRLNQALFIIQTSLIQKPCQDTDSECS